MATRRKRLSNHLVQSKKSHSMLESILLLLMLYCSCYAVPLFHEDFEPGHTIQFSSYTASSCADNGENKWVVNNKYAGGHGTNDFCFDEYDIPNIDNQPAGIAASPNSYYMHIASNELIADGISNAAFVPADHICYISECLIVGMSADIDTSAYTNVTLSFWWLLGGNSEKVYGNLLTSVNGGDTWNIVPLKYADTPNWTFKSLTFTQKPKGVVNQPGFGIDEIHVEGNLPNGSTQTESQTQSQTQSLTQSQTEPQSTQSSDEEKIGGGDNEFEIAGINGWAVVGVGGGLLSICALFFIAFIIVSLRTKKAPAVELEMQRSSSKSKSKSVSQPKKRGHTTSEYHNSSIDFESSEDAAKAEKRNTNFSPLPGEAPEPPASSENQHSSNLYTPPTKPVTARETSWEIAYTELEFEKEIGRGAFGVVFKGTWRNAPICIKRLIIPDGQAATEQLVNNFRAEAEVMRSIRPHLNVLLYLGICTDPLCLITEFMPMGSLFDLLHSPAPIANKAILQILNGIASGMYHLSIEGIVHRDLASRNVLLTRDLEAKISDFGMSRILDPDQESNKTDSVVGPLKWMSPEAISDRVYSEASDVWSYGVLCIEVFTRQKPYPGLAPLQVASRVGTKNLRPEIPPNVPPQIASIMAACFQWEPQDRPGFKIICQQLKLVIVDPYDNFITNLLPSAQATNL